ncbi:MAG: type I-E CRISPR-associated protein Cse2/CasB [Methanomicrobiaceae archaeon]|nr:type I-E CRISPR-associated protein Cse2/CasB [Methanomicrobiaceae archaeon]
MIRKKELNYLNFQNGEISTILGEWWESLDEDRGERAVLRRCKSYEEVAFSPAYYRLRKSLVSAGFSVRNDDLALVAGVISHVRKQSSEGKFSALMAESKKGASGPVVSEKRFRKLLSVQDKSDLYLTMIRLIKMTDDAAPINDVASGLYWWNERTKKNWAFAYYDKIL